MVPCRARVSLLWALAVTLPTLGCADPGEPAEKLEDDSGPVQPGPASDAGQDASPDARATGGDTAVMDGEVPPPDGRVPGEQRDARATQWTGNAGECGRVGDLIALPADLALLQGCALFHGSIEISGSELVDLDVLRGLRTLGGSLTIRGNARLTSLAGLEGLESVAGGVTLSDNPQLVALSGLSLSQVEGELTIRNNAALQTLTGGGATSVGALRIEHNLGLRSVLGWRGSASDGVFVIDNPQLSDADGYGLASGAVLFAERDTPIVVSGNKPPKDMPPLACGAPEDRLYLNTNFVELEGCTSFRGTIDLSNTVLRTLQGLGNLRAIGGTLNLFRPMALTDLRGLDLLETVDGELSIRLSDRLETLAGLEQLRTVGELRIDANGPLHSIEGLARLESVARDLMIHDNSLLLEASARALAERVKVGGEVGIGGNKM